METEESGLPFSWRCDMLSAVSLQTTCWPLVQTIQNRGAQSVENSEHLCSVSVAGCKRAHPCKPARATAALRIYEPGLTAF